MVCKKNFSILISYHQFRQIVTDLLYKVTDDGLLKPKIFKLKSLNFVYFRIFRLLMLRRYEDLVKSSFHRN